jgi:hypothetical protein
VRSSRNLFALLTLAGCATGRAPSPLDVSYAAARAQEGCQPAGDATCCERLSRQMHQARARRDDRRADEEAERLALTCPARRESILEPGRGGPFYRRDLDEPHALARIEYQLRLPPEDHVAWVASYVDGARLGPWMPAGRHTLELALDVVSGLPPTAGKIIHLTRTATVTLAPGALFLVTVRLGRAGGEPLIEVELPPGAEGAGVPATREETVGIGDTQAPEPRDHWPDFEPPLELQSAGAPPLSVDLCPDAQGHVTAVSFPSSDGAPHAHPRQLAAALEWTRQLTFESPRLSNGWFACAHLLVGLDARHLPPLTHPTRYRRADDGRRNAGTSAAAASSDSATKR